jgi:hypothetical protein
MRFNLIASSSRVVMRDSGLLCRPSKFGAPRNDDSHLEQLHPSAYSMNADAC